MRIWSFAAAKQFEVAGEVNVRKPFLGLRQVVRNAFDQEFL
jgi:hypothetical protein